MAEAPSGGVPTDVKVILTILIIMWLGSSYIETRTGRSGSAAARESTATYTTNTYYESKPSYDASLYYRTHRDEFYGYYGDTADHSDYYSNYNNAPVYEGNGIYYEDK